MTPPSLGPAPRTLPGRSGDSGLPALEARVTSGAPLRLSDSRQVRCCWRCRVLSSSTRPGQHPAAAQSREVRVVGLERDGQPKAERLGRLRGQSWRDPRRGGLGRATPEEEGTPRCHRPTSVAN